MLPCIQIGGGPAQLAGLRFEELRAISCMLVCWDSVHILEIITRILREVCLFVWLINPEQFLHVLVKDLSQRLFCQTTAAPIARGALQKRENVSQDWVRELGITSKRCRTGQAIIKHLQHVQTCWRCLIINNRCNPCRSRVSRLYVKTLVFCPSQSPPHRHYAPCEDEDWLLDQEA